MDAAWHELEQRSTADGERGITSSLFWEEAGQETVDSEGVGHPSPYVM